MKDFEPKRLKKETRDGAEMNLDALYQLFPSCFTEAPDALGEVRRVVDWQKLRALLGEYVEDGEPEVYDFTWVGKRAAQREAATPCRKTLRPCPEESVDWDKTQNLYIEGDNLEVLKLLQNSYMGKVKMIYIDPPYNTGNDFVYHDDFTMDKEVFDESTSDEEGNRYYKNTDSNGRFHSDWCSMIYARLMVARSLLTDDGVIFISIDECESDNLKKICDEVFGSYNFITQFIWQNKKGGGNDSAYVAVEHEYVISYAKNKPSLAEFYEKYSPEYEKRYKEKDEIGRFFWDTFKRKSGKQYYPIKCPDGSVLQFDEDGNPISWLRSEERFKSDIEKGEIRIIPSQSSGWSVQFKQRMPAGKKPRSIFKTGVLLTDKGTTSTGGEDVYDYFKKDVFSNPKPIDLVSYFMGFGLGQNDLVMDFFSGSGTTAEAVMKLNVDGGNRKFIIVQLQENIEDMLSSSSENAKRIARNAISVLDELQVPHLLTEIAKERIRRAGKKIKADSPLTTQDLDIGFRVLKCDESNYKPVAFAPKDYTQESLDMFLDNIKEERTGLDLLFDCMMRWGLELSLPYETQKVDGCTIYNVDEGSLVACFDGVVTSAVIDAIAETHPLRVVFRDSSFTEAAQKMNLFELFKQKCGWTDEEVKNNVRVI